MGCGAGRNLTFEVSDVRDLSDRGELAEDVVPDDKHPDNKTRANPQEFDDVHYLLEFFLKQVFFILLLLFYRLFYE